METSPLSPDDVRAAAAVHNELGPHYQDAVLESFLAKIDDEIGARIDARLATTPAGKQVRKSDRERDIDPVAAARRGGWQGGLAVGTLIGTAIAGVPLSLLAFHAGADWTGWVWQLYLMWAVIAAVYCAGVAGVLLWNKRHH